MDRSFLLERGRINLDTGRFPLTLFTNGEASDGHIIDIRGLEVAERVPMFVNHDADPTRRMGRLEDPKKPGKTTQLGRASLKMQGVIDMEGDSHNADVRRDVAHGIHVGDITAMSGRWDPIEAIPRASLPESHYAHSQIEGGWDTPMFFKRATVLEGSVVGVPADSAALIGRSQDLQKPEHVRQFYDVLVHGDPLSREEALKAMHLDAAEIPKLEEIETVDGLFFVPRDVAAKWQRRTFPVGMLIAGDDEDELDDDYNESREAVDASSEPATEAAVDAPSAAEPETEAVDAPVERIPVPMPGMGFSEESLQELEAYVAGCLERSQVETRHRVEELFYRNMGSIPNVRSSHTDRSRDRRS